MTVRTRPDEERVWLQAMIASLGGLAAIDVIKPGGDVPPPDAWERVNKDLAKDAAQMADFAIEEWRERYPEIDPVTVEEESGL